MAAISRVSNLSTASQDEISEMKEVFACFDKDSSGTVTTQELGLVLKSMNKNFSEDELKKIVSKFDFNGDGQIDFDEFFALMTRHEKKEVDELKQAFNVFDKDSDGTITSKELEIVMKALGEPIDRETIDLMIESVDTDKNGSIDFDEFKKMMKDGPSDLA
jgi:calmodulin